MTSRKTPEKRPGNKAVDRRKRSSRNSLNCVYLYYRCGGEWRVYEWHDFYNHIDDPIAQITKLALNAHQKGSDPPCFAVNPKPDQMMMRRRGYLVFVVGDKEWAWNPQVKTEIVVVKTDSTSYPCPTAKSFDKHISFEIATSVGKLLVIFCENSMQSLNDHAKTDLGPFEPEDFIFKLPFQEKASGREPDAGGTNMGPPVPPP
jgi:hypothetical protein